MCQASFARAAAKFGVVCVSVADVRSATGAIPATLNYDPQEETQLLYGEGVEIFDHQGEWLKIGAVEQPEFSHNRRWESYPGWVKKDAILKIKRPPDMKFVVKTKSSRIHDRPDFKSSFLPVSMGTKLDVTGDSKKGFWKVRKVDGDTGWIAMDEVRLLTPPLPESFTRKMITDSASELLGDPYFWGGRSANLPDLANQVTAVDCSGLVNLAYRVAGIDIPRDSYEQYQKSRKIKKEELKTGDLIFSGPKDDPNKIFKSR